MKLEGIEGCGKKIEEKVPKSYGAPLSRKTVARKYKQQILIYFLASVKDVKTLILRFVPPSADPRDIPSLNSFFAWQLRRISYLENLWGTATPHIEIGNTNLKKESCAVLRKIWNASVFHQKSKRCRLASENSCAALPIVW